MTNAENSEFDSRESTLDNRPIDEESKKTYELQPAKWVTYFGEPTIVEIEKFWKSLKSERKEKRYFRYLTKFVILWFLLTSLIAVFGFALTQIMEHYGKLGAFFVGLFDVFYNFIVIIKNYIINLIDPPTKNIENIYDISFNDWYF